MSRTHVLFPLFVIGCLLIAGPAQAQLQQAQVQGAVRSPDTGRPLAGVTVVVSGPALQADQTEFTDGDGRYLITQLPPGDHYNVRFYFSSAVVERTGIRLTQGQTLQVNASISLSSGSQQAYVIRERAPNVDVGSATLAAEINQEILENTALRGRTYESIVQMAPGTIDTSRGLGNDVGVSIAGATGYENSFIIDGLSTTDTNFGNISTPLHPYFIREVRVLTGGLQAEYGRTTGGLVSVLTKNGSNQFHGGVFFNIAPVQLAAPNIARLGEALATSSRQSLQMDFGFDLGGPIWKDRIWFYVGFVPTLTTTSTDRVVRRLAFDPARGAGAIDPGFSCPAYLSDDSLCAGPRTLALLTTEIPERTQRLEEQVRLYNVIGKLQFNLGANHGLTLGYIGALSDTNAYIAYRDNLDARRYTQQDQIHDVTARYLGKLLSHRLQIEALYGMHYQHYARQPFIEDKPNILYRASPQDPFSLGDFEAAPECQRQSVTGADGKSLLFNPCPLTSYFSGGLGFFEPNIVRQRHALQASATAYLRLLGQHALRLGVDIQIESAHRERAYTGTDFEPGNLYSGRVTYATDAAGTGIRRSGGIVSTLPMDSFGNPGADCGIAGGVYCYGKAAFRLETHNYGLFLRDSWSPSFAPGLSVNAGLRWEAQELFDLDGVRQIGIYNNLAPRAGLVYDFTRKGRSRLFAHYGRYYESIPQIVNDRKLSNLGVLSAGTAPFSKDCATEVLQPGGRPVVLPEPAPGKPCSLDPGILNSGGRPAIILPGIQGQNIHEVVAGFQYDVGLDVVLGLSYTYRTLGDVLDDMLADNFTSAGLRPSFLGNPGTQPDPDVVRQLQEEARQAQEAAARSPGDAALQTASVDAAERERDYRIAAIYPRARREYHALTLTAQKRFSNRFSLLASYTYSRLFGNYAGTYNPQTGQSSPHTGVLFSWIDLHVNQDGPLSNDRPHNIKLTGYYQQPIGRRGQLTAGLTFTAYSGRPIEVLGAGPRTNTLHVLLLPRGSGGRTPTVSQFDLHLGYSHQLRGSMSLSCFVDLVNLLNQQAVTNVDQEYTASIVNPIRNGVIEDLRYLRALDGTAVVPNSNYGQATAYQVPFTMRAGARLSF